MIPEHIERLISSDNKDDHRLMFELAKRQELVDDEFQYRVYWSQMEPALIEEYIDRAYSGVDKKPYKYFRWKNRSLGD